MYIATNPGARASPPPSSAPRVQVSPLLASILLQFQDRASWRAAELAAALGTSPDALRRKIIFWINQGVLSEAKADGALVYARNESLQSSGAMAERRQQQPQAGRGG